MSYKNQLQEKYHHFRHWLPKAERGHLCYETVKTNDGFTSSIPLQLSESLQTIIFGGPCLSKKQAEQEAAFKALTCLLDIEKVSEAKGNKADNLSSSDEEDDEQEDTFISADDDEDETSISDNENTGIVIDVSHQKRFDVKSYKFRWYKVIPSSFSSDIYLGVHLAYLFEQINVERIIIYDPENRINSDVARAFGVAVAHDQESLVKMMQSTAFVNNYTLL